MLSYQLIVALIIGALTGGIFGFVSLLWDAMDGNVEWYLGFIHSKAGYDLLAVLAVTGLWAINVVDGYWVISALVSLFAHLLVAYVTSVTLLPLIQLAIKFVTDYMIPGEEVEQGG